MSSSKQKHLTDSHEYRNKTSNSIKSIFFIRLGLVSFSRRILLRKFRILVGHGPPPATALSMTQLLRVVIYNEWDHLVKFKYEYAFTLP